MKLGQHFGLTNLCRFGGMEKKGRVFKDLSAPPLVLASDIKIHSCCKGFKILLTVLHSLFDTCSLTLKNTKPESCGVPLQQSYQGANAGKMNAGWRCYSWGIAYIFHLYFLC